jgi:hypothetical protein
MRPIITRADALALGLTRYFTGKPCRNSHIAERYTGKADCVECKRNEGRRQGKGSERVLRWRKRHPEKAKAARRRDYYRPGSRYRVLIRESNRVAAARRGGFAPPPRESECPPRPADGRCQCCHKVGKRIVMHHSHDTGDFVAWACDRCNTQLSEYRIDDFGQPRPRPAEHVAKIKAAMRQRSAALRQQADT